MQVAPEKERITNALQTQYQNMGLDDVIFMDDSDVKWLCWMMTMSHPTTILIDLKSGMNLGFCQKATNDCVGFWMTQKDIWGKNGIVFCPRCQFYNWNATKRQDQCDANKGDRTNTIFRVSLRYLSPTSTT